MKINVFIGTWLVLALASCEPEWEQSYEHFTIPKGKHSSGAQVQMLQSEELAFYAIFDESARYTTAIEENQWDTNKLLGFADCNSHHHTHSARFGWRWLNDSLQILAYCYVDGERVIEEIGAVTLNKPSYYSLRMTSSHYIFQLNHDPPVSIPRKNTCEIGAYYMLWPYFGGDETAPHDILIQVKIQF